MSFPENTYPTDPDLPEPSNQVRFDVNLWNVITGYITDISNALAGISDNNGNVNLPSGEYISFVNIAKTLKGLGGVSVDCDGTHYAAAANSSIHNVTTQDICVSAWIKLDDDSAGIEGIIAKRNTTSGAGYFFGIDDTTFGGADGVLILYISDGAHTYTLTGNTNLRDGEWHHVAGIIDRSAAATCKLYVDGSEDGTTNKAGTVTDVDSITNTMIIMSLGKGSYADRIFDGQIADAKIYYAAGATWTETQVDRQYENPYNRTAAVIGTITDGWFCDDKTGTTIDGGYDLTLTNSVAWSTEGPAVVVQGDNVDVDGDISLASLVSLGLFRAYHDSTAGTITIGGNLTISGDIRAETISETTIAIEQIATPSDPADDSAHLWNDDGAGAHDVGDIMVALTFGEVTKTKKLVDFA